jgi:hypothetical protein
MEINFFVVSLEKYLLDGSSSQLKVDIYDKSRELKSGFRITSPSGDFIDLDSGSYYDFINGLGWGPGKTSTALTNDKNPSIRHFIVVNLKSWTPQELFDEYGTGWLKSAVDKEFLEMAFPRLVDLYREFKINQIFY